MRYIPNSFQIANAVVDDFLSRLSGNAWKCYAVIVRKTTGWQKEMDYIPVAQFKTITGIKKSETVTDCLKELEQFGLIESIKQMGKVTGYRLNMPAPTPEKEGYLPPKNGGTTTPEKGGYPKNGTTPENGGYPPPKIGGTTTPENGGSSKHTTKPTNTKHNIHASAAADAPVPADQPKPKAKKPDRHREDLATLASLGVGGQLAEDWLQTRKEKRAGSLTHTVVAGLQREAAKAGLTVPQAVQVAAERGWARFNASYLRNEAMPFASGQKPKNNTVPKHENGGFQEWN